MEKRPFAVQHRPRKRRHMSAAQLRRAEYEAEVPALLQLRGAAFAPLGEPQPETPRFPHTSGRPVLSLEPASPAQAPAQRIAVVFCGRQAPGGHDVVAGLLDALASEGAEGSGELLGVVGGTKGLFEQRVLRLSAEPELVSLYRHQGGYDLLGRSVDSLRTPEQLRLALKACQALALTGLVLVGGARTATDAAGLAEHLAANGVGTKVVAVPAEIDGTLMSGGLMEMAVGFDTSTKISAQLVANLATDAKSSRKYTCFVRLLGRAPSHVVLEVALQTRPNKVILSEEVAAKRMTLPQLVGDICDLVARRSAKGMDFGVIVLGEGLIGAMPEMRALIDEIDAVYPDLEQLTPWSRALLDYLPPDIRRQLLGREHGSVPLTQVETDRLLAELCEREMAKRKAAGTFSGKFAYLTSFFGYQSRSGMPSNFDCSLGVSLGRTAAALVQGGHSGYAASITGLAKPVSEWAPVAVPLVSLLSPPSSGSGGSGSGSGSASAWRSGAWEVPVAPVSLHSPAYRAYAAQREAWEGHDDYHNPGPVQFAGSCADQRPLTLACDEASYLDRIRDLQGMLDSVRAACAPGCPAETLQAALGGVKQVVEVLSLLPQ